MFENTSTYFKIKKNKYTILNCLITKKHIKCVKLTVFMRKKNIAKINTYLRRQENEDQ